MMMNPENNGSSNDETFRPAVPDLTSYTDLVEDDTDDPRREGSTLYARNPYQYSPTSLQSAEKIAQTGLELDISASSARGRLENFERESQILRPDITQALSFIHKYGLNTKPVYFLKPEFFKTVRSSAKDAAEVGGFYDAHADAIAMKYDVDDMREKYGGDYALHFQGLVVHEMAHSSSEYQNRFSIDDEDGQINRYYRVGNFVNASGNALEEGFCDYLRKRFFEESEYDPHIGPIYGTPEATDFAGDSSTLTFNQYGGQTLTLMEGVPKPPVKEIVEVLVNNRERGLNGYVDRSLLWNNSEAGTLRGDAIQIVGYPYLAQAISFLIEDDPTLFDAFIQSRSDVEGLRKIAQKLNALQPGLYKRLRDTDSKNAVEFQQAVVDALHAKYFPEGKQAATQDTV